MHLYLSVNRSVYCMLSASHQSFRLQRGASAGRNRCRRRRRYWRRYRRRCLEWRRLGWDPMGVMVGILEVSVPFFFVATKVGEKIHCGDIFGIYKLSCEHHIFGRDHEKWHQPELDVLIWLKEIHENYHTFALFDPKICSFSWPMFIPWLEIKYHPPTLWLRLTVNPDVVEKCVSRFFRFFEVKKHNSIPVPPPAGRYKYTLVN